MSRKFWLCGQLVTCRLIINNKNFLVINTISEMKFRVSCELCIHNWGWEQCSMHAVTTLPCMIPINAHHAVTNPPCSQCTIRQSPISHAPNAQSCSHLPPMLLYAVHNHAVTYLPCSQCTIMQSLTSHAPNVQSCSHWPPMLPMHNHAVTKLPMYNHAVTYLPAPICSAKSDSHQPPMLPMYNYTVTYLPCSQCTIMQSPTSHAPNAQSCMQSPTSHTPHSQSCSHQPPMLHIHNHAVTNLPCSTCTIRQSPTFHAQLPCYVTCMVNRMLAKVCMHSSRWKILQWLFSELMGLISSLTKLLSRALQVVLQAIPPQSATTRVMTADS